MFIFKPIKAVFAWIVAVVQSIHSGEQELDEFYPDRHKASGAEAATNASIAGHMSGGGMGGLV